MRVHPDWARLGLTHNPFENEVPPGCVELPPAVREAVARRPFVVQLVGDKGAGKTTLSRWYCAGHPDAGYVYARRDDGAMPDWTGLGALCLDEANAFPRRRLSALVKGARQRGLSLLVTTHVPLGRVLEPARTLFLAKHVALGWVAQRVESARVGGPVGVDFEAIARRLVPALTQVNYAVLRVLYEYAENAARGLEGTAALDDAIARARLDPTVADCLRPAGAAP